MGNVRVLPLLVFSGLCLLGLKAMGLMLSGGYVLSGSAPASAQGTQPAAMQAGPAKEKSAGPEMQDTQSPVKNDEAEMLEKKEAAEEAEIAPPEMQIVMAGPARGGTSKAELKILEGLSDRRKTLERRARELGLRENLLEAAEKRVEARINELKAIESRIEGVLKKHDDQRNAEYSRLVKMYSGMKPKDAARIFNRLDMRVLTSLASQIKPRVMSAILAAMTPAAAERLTLEIAARGRPKIQSRASLPKIRSKQAN